MRNKSKKTFQQANANTVADASLRAGKEQEMVNEAQTAASFGVAVKKALKAAADEIKQSIR